MKGYLVTEFSYNSDSHYVYLDREEANKKFWELAKDNGAKDDEKENIIEDGEFLCNGCTLVHLRECEVHIDSKKMSFQHNVEILFCNVFEDDFPKDILAFLDETPEQCGYIRHNKAGTETVEVFEPYVAYENKLLKKYLTEGSF